MFDWWSDDDPDFFHNRFWWWDSEGIYVLPPNDFMELHGQHSLLSDLGRGVGNNVGDLLAQLFGGLARQLGTYAAFGLAGYAAYRLVRRI